uniref:Protein kinase domain-containing protein n=1 Tax=Haemonchus contortus TaxID=6289 RepID=A0A7I4Y666_HAECO|nr:Serine threonine protein kinase-related domain containing protein [Haemonchus contortus]
MMVSNIMVINDLTASRIDGARCSAKVLDGMCSKMASSSTSCTSAPLETAASSEDSGDSCPATPHFKCAPHPFATVFGQFYAADDFDVLEMLGEGFFSKVSKVRLRSTGEEMVLKKAKSNGTAEHRRAVHADAAREAAMLHRLSHENILGLRGVCIQVAEDGCWDMHLLVDYCEGGSLSRLILDHSTPFPWCQRVRYALDIALAMQYIHAHKIIHRDLTSMNVLLQTSHESSVWGRAVVADFGLSCRFPRRGEKLPQVGTTYFMSPECLKEEYYDGKSDVFSFGVIMCQLIARIDADPDSGLHRTSNFGLDYVRFTPCCPLDTPISFLKLAFHSCVMDPLERPSFEMIVILLQNVMNVVPSSPSQLEVRGESRLSRSRSDAALKKPAAAVMAARKMSSNYSKTVRPIIEGESTELENSFLAMERLARDVARDEPTLDHTNPFLDHERFRKERKILPRRGSRRRSETKPERGLSDGNCLAVDHVRFSPHSSHFGVFRRRCSSLPPDVDSPFISRDLVDEKSEFCPGGVPLVYRDFDMKFLKQMKRFPSRRHTLIPECGTVRSTLDLQSLRSNPTSSSFLHSTTATLSSTSDVNGPSVRIEETPDHQPYTQSVLSTDHLLPDCPLASPEYSPNTGDRLNNNQSDVCDFASGRPLAKGPAVIVDTIVRSPTTFSGTMCVTAHCETSHAHHGKHQKCIIL